MGEHAANRQQGKISEIGHGNIAHNPVPGGATVKEIRRIASIFFAGLERLRFGDASAEACMAGRATLAARTLEAPNRTPRRFSLVTLGHKASSQTFHPGLRTGLIAAGGVSPAQPTPFEYDDEYERREEGTNHDHRRPRRR